MNKRRWAVVVSMALVTAVGSPALGGARIVERIIARVNSEIITQQKYDEEKEKLRGQLAEQYSGAEFESEFAVFKCKLESIRASIAPA